jgi:uncharacterized protein Usg
MSREILNPEEKIKRMKDYDMMNMSILYQMPKNDVQKIMDSFMALIRDIGVDYNTQDFVRFFKIAREIGIEKAVENTRKHIIGI